MSDAVPPSEGAAGQRANPDGTSAASASEGPSGSQRYIGLPKIEYDEYWSHKIAETAKKKVLTYFAILGLVVSVIVTLFGMDRIRTIVDEQYVAALKEREAEASARVASLAEQFEGRLEILQRQAEVRSREFHVQIDSTLLKVQSYSSRESRTRIDLSAQIGPIRDQGNEGSVIGFAISYALTAVQKQSNGEEHLYSARSIYVEAKRHDEWQGENYEGSSVLGGMKALTNIGAYLEEDWPYDRLQEPLANRKPAIQISGYTEIPHQRTDQIIAALASGTPVVVSLTVTTDFQEVDQSGKIDLSDQPEIIGGHAVCLVGYNGETDEFKFANSWGAKWGDGGFGYLSRADLSEIIVHAATLSF
jgi:C1A family cysteine protease